MNQQDSGQDARPDQDPVAIEQALTQFVMPHSVLVPIAAKDEADISTYIGEVTTILSKGSPNKAMIVEPYRIPKKDSLPIWELPGSDILHSPRQVWVHVDYSGYRKAYLTGLGDTVKPGHVLDHVMNRRIARLKGFSYIRLVPISRAANSSSGSMAEQMGVAYHSSPRMRRLNAASKARIQYADLSDVVKMLNIKTGGSLQDPVNMAQALITYPKQ